MPAGVVLASTAAIVPQRVASAGRSWNQIRARRSGPRLGGGEVGSQATRCCKGQVLVVLAEVGLQSRVELGHAPNVLSE